MSDISYGENMKPTVKVGDEALESMLIMLYACGVHDGKFGEKPTVKGYEYRIIEIEQLFQSHARQLEQRVLDTIGCKVGHLETYCADHKTPIELCHKANRELRTKLKGVFQG